jgi:serine/threonine protein kinase
MTIDEATFAGAHLEIPSTIGNWKYVRKLGCGAWSAVIEVVNADTGEHLACKVVSRADLTASGDFRLFEQELRVQQFLHHPNIVGIRDVVYKPDLVFVFLDLCTGGDLLTYLMKQSKLPPSEIREIGCHILEALTYIHARGITHRDIKPDNIFLTDTGTAKVGDFGLSEVESRRSTAKQSGTLIYAAPEIFTQSDSVTTKVDIWAFGIMLYTHSTGRIPWTDEDNEHLMDQIVQRAFQSTFLLPREILGVFEKCTQLDPAARPSAAQLLALPFFQGEAPQVKPACSAPLVALRAAPKKSALTRKQASVTKSTLGLSLSLRPPVVVRPGMAPTPSFGGDL